MRKGLRPDDLDGLLDRPLLAVLATYRANGDVLLSPVWHRWRDGGFEVVTGGNDVKVRQLDDRFFRPCVTVAGDYVPIKATFAI